MRLPSHKDRARFSVAFFADRADPSLPEAVARAPWSEGCVSIAALTVALRRLESW